MDYRTAMATANHLVERFAPHCERIEIAGSIRRKKAIVKNIELVCIPKQEPTGLFDMDLRHSVGFAALCLELSRGGWKKGDTGSGKFIAINTATGLRIDIFTTTADNWGYILTLRTGSSDHNIRLMQRLKSNGYRCADGHVMWKGEAREMVDEMAVFDAAGLKWVDPQFRV